MSSKLPARRGKPHSSKPYDRPKSFLQRVSKHVAEYIPSWLNPSSWVQASSTSTEQSSNDYADEETGEETEEDIDVAGPSNKTAPVNQKSSVLGVNSPLYDLGSVSYARKPLERSPSKQNIVNGDDHSDNSETSASTSGCSSLAPSQERKRGTAEARGINQLKGLQVSKFHLEKIQKQLNSNPLFAIPDQDINHLFVDASSEDPVEISTSVAPHSYQGTGEKSRKRVLVENHHTTQTTDKDAETSSTRTSLWSEDEGRASQSAKRSHTTKPQPLAPNKRPCFSVSAFGSPHRVAQDLNRQPSENSMSPFYPGQTAYGGASAYKKARISIPYKSALRAEAVKVRQGGSREVLSSAAQKVLNVLENMSTPLTDAKKIPVEKVSTDFALSYTPSIYARKPLRLDTPQTPVSSGPPTTSFPVQSSHSSPSPLLAMLSQTVPSRTTSIPQPVTQNTGPEQRSGGAVRTRVSQSSRPSRQQKGVHEETATPPPLPDVPLVLGGIIPAFSFSIPTLTSTPVTAESHPSTVRGKLEKPTSAALSEAKTQVTTTPSPVQKFAFSSPIVNKPPPKPKEVTDDSGKGIESNFQFRSPVIKTNLSTESVKSTAPIVNFNFTGPVNSSSTSPLKRKAPVEKEPEESKNDGVKIAPELIVGGSVMDILGEAASKPTESKVVSQNTAGFGSAFRKKSSEWECGVCMVQNKESDSSCIACTNPRPGPKPSIDVPTASTTTQGFGNAFRKKSSEWECGVCMVRNKESDSSCIACTSPRPGPKPSVDVPTASTTTQGFGKKFAPPSGSWSCAVCMVRNSESNSACIACSEPMPGKSKPVVEVAAASPISSDLPSEAPTKPWSGPAKSPGDWECDTCLVRNKAGTSKCCACETPRLNASATVGKDSFSGFKFGQQSKGSPAAASPFKFGIPSSSSAKPVTPLSGFVFAGTDVKESNSQTTTGFKFGLANVSETPKVSEDSKPSSTVEKASSAPGESPFKFGSANLTPSSEGFKFGLPSKPSETVNNQVTSKSLDKSDSASESKGTGKSAFVFGGQLPITEKKPETTPTLTFGQKTVEPAKSKESVISVENKSVTKDTEKTPWVLKSGELGAPSSGFSFGVSTPKQSVTVSEQSNAVLPSSDGGLKHNFGTQLERKPDLSTGESNEKTNVMAVFGFGSQLASESVDQKMVPSLSTAAAITTTTASSGFQITFKGKESSQDNTLVTRTFGVSQAPASVSSSTPSFTTGANNLSTIKPSPSFGITSQPLVSTTSSNAVISNPPVETQSSTGNFVFGSSKPAQASAPNSGGFTFGFGSSGAKPLGTSSVFSFGSTTSNTSTSLPPMSSPFAFGKVGTNTLTTTIAQQQPQQQSTPVFSFGGQTNPNTTSGSGFGTAQPAKPVFAFNGPSVPVVSAPPSLPVSVFGQQPAAVVAPSTEPFRFGANPAAASVTSTSGGMFQMEASKPVALAPTNSNPVFRFGAPQVESGAGHQPLFGAQQPVSSGRFTFGSTAVPTTVSSMTSQETPFVETPTFVFGSAPNTGANVVAPAPGSPFNFQPAGAPAAASNPFNVSGNVNSAQRPMRKAIRRVVKKK